MKAESETVDEIADRGTDRVVSQSGPQGGDVDGCF